MSQREEAVKWNAELEVALFHSMHGHKPVGEYVTLFVARECRVHISKPPATFPALLYFSLGSVHHSSKKLFGFQTSRRTDELPLSEIFSGVFAF